MQAPESIKGILIYAGLITVIWVTLCICASFILSNPLSPIGWAIGGLAFWIVLSVFWYYYIIIKKKI